MAESKCDFWTCPLLKNIGVFIMTNAEDKAFGSGFFVGAVFLVVPSLILGSWLAKMDFKNAAVEAKVGEYNPQTGEFQFKKMYNIMEEKSSIED